MKISILLPYKENYSPEYPGAVSLFVNATSKLSKYKSNITVYGSTNYKNYLSKNTFDILIHTAILGGRRTKEETGDVVHYNLIMFENILKVADKFKLIINFDSAAIYDRSTDILNRKENELYSVPNDYYGFSKYLIYQQSLLYSNIIYSNVFVSIFSNSVISFFNQVDEI